MTLTISKYKLSKQQYTITLDYTLGETENLFTDLYAYDLQEWNFLAHRNAVCKT